MSVMFVRLRSNTTTNTNTYTERQERYRKTLTKVSTQYEPINMERWVTFNRKES
jgi:hypothetical protein